MLIFLPGRLIIFWIFFVQTGHPYLISVILSLHGIGDHDAVLIESSTTVQNYTLHQRELFIYGPEQT